MINTKRISLCSSHLFTAVVGVLAIGCTPIKMVSQEVAVTSAPSSAAVDLRSVQATLPTAAVTTNREVATTAVGISTTTPAAVISATPAAVPPATTCNEYMRILGEENFAGPIQVELDPIDNIGLSAGPTPYAYMGFGITFIAKKPIGEETFVGRFKPDAAGFTVKFRDSATNLSVAVPNSAYVTIPHLPLEQNTGLAVSISNISRPRKSISFNVANSFFFANSRNLSTTQVELYCFNRLVASGIQDFKSLDYPLNILYKLININGTAGYVSSDAVGGFINLTCPYDVAAGSAVHCTAGGLGLENIYWLINGKRASNFDQLQDIRYLQESADTHTVQAIATLSNGKEMRSMVRTIVIR